MRKKLVVGNWKMHGSLVENQKLLRDVQTGLAGAKSAECAVCVPFPYLAQAQVLLNGTAIAWGASGERLQQKRGEGRNYERQRDGKSKNDVNPGLWSHAYGRQGILAGSRVLAVTEGLSNLDAR